MIFQDMLSFENAREIINREIDSLVIHRQPDELYQPVKYILSIGGKRIRPAMVLMGCDLFSGQISGAIKPALGIEIFHNFTLLHDDIMDNSPLRRNHPTVHEKWNRNIAILSGDVMSMLAYKFIGDCPKEILPEVLELFTTTAMEVCEGQQYDMNFESRHEVSADEYIRMITLKTSVLLAASLKLGAIIGGASRNDAERMYEFGKNTGIAFQIKDDILDVYGNTEKFGKKIGTDIIANKKTYLILKALDVADDTSGKILKELIAATHMDPGEKIRMITGIFNQLGIREMAEIACSEFYDKGLQAFDGITAPAEKKEPLKGFIGKLINREM
jgi:geranylgeranyl diphosphate synthase type II